MPQLGRPKSSFIHMPHGTEMQETLEREEV